MSKQIKIECGGVGHKAKIYVDGKDLLKQVPGLYGIELRIFVDEVVQLKLYQHGKPVVFEGEAKIIKIFGEKEYCLVTCDYVDDLRKKILSLKAELKK